MVPSIIYLLWIMVEKCNILAVCLCGVNFDIDGTMDLYKYKSILDNHMLIIICLEWLFQQDDYKHTSTLVRDWMQSHRICVSGLPRAPAWT